VIIHYSLGSNQVVVLRSFLNNFPEIYVKLHVYPVMAAILDLQSYWR